jgi:hypothetical protein
MARTTKHLLGRVGLGAALAAVSFLGLASPALANQATAPGQQKKAADAGASSGSSSSGGSSSGSASQGGQAPAGNNGTVKINDSAVDDGPNNEPHVGCTFYVNFYGYDAGLQSASMTFEPWSPTKGGQTTTLNTSWSTAERTGGNQLDKAYGPVDLSSALAGVTPHPKQGYHVKLTVHVTGSQGSDVKHKVFWIAPCTLAVSGTAHVPTPPVVSGTEIERPSAIGTPASEQKAEVVPAATKTEVLGETLTRTPSTRPAALARTGISIVTLLLWALALVGLGVLLVRASRARRTSSI